jgi:hypothetical protein
MPDGVRLLCHSLDDLNIFSALTQDSVVRVGTMHYDQRARRFGLLLNRYRWEADRQRARIRTLLYFNSVTHVQSRGFAINDRHHVLNLLAVTATLLGHDPEDPSLEIILRFAAGASVRLTCEGLDALLEDVSSSWGAKSRPTHNPEEA